MSCPIYSLSDSDCSDKKDSDVEDYLLDSSSPLTKKTKVESNPIYPLSDSDCSDKKNSDVEDYLLNFSSPLTKKIKVKPNSIYSLSDSDCSDKKNSDVEDYLLNFTSPLTKKTKVKSNVSQLPAKKTRSPTKTHRSRKTDEEKKRLQLEKQLVKEEKLRLKEEKLRLKEEKQKAAEEKIRMKNEKKKECELWKQMKPGECMKFISVFIDSNLLNCKFGGEILTELTKAEINHTVLEQVVPGTISWQRNGENQDEDVPNHVVVIWMWEEFITLLSQKKLDATVDEIVQKYPNHELTIVIFGIEEYFRQRKKLENRELKSKTLGKQSTRKKKNDVAPEVFSNFSRSDVEIALTSLQLRRNQQYHFFETNEEVGLFVYQFTKAMAELPYKLQKRKKQDMMEWFAEADSLECVSIDKHGNGFLRLWQEQLRQFPNIGLDAAQAVAAEYPSPTLLMEAYDQCSTRKEGEMLLQNIQVRRQQGPLPSTVRRVGPQFSKRAFHFFTTTNGSEMLSMED